MPRTYLGLRGTKLNIAIGVIAGLDFLYALASYCERDKNKSQD